LGAALVPGFCYPLPDGRYRAEYAEPVDIDRYRDMDRDAAIAAITQELARVQENYIREHPECWLWMHRRWRTRPPEENDAPATAASDESTVDDEAAVPELR
jgi:KDO2-lipid IV(A) lauroyltransferase